MSTPYRMPAIDVGVDVWWFPAEGAPPHAAKVAALGFDTVCLHVFDPTLKSLDIKDGVRHVGDQRAKSFEVRENGLWDFTPLQKAQGVPETLERLRKQAEPKNPDKPEGKK